jgi:Protein of unknown function (DUF3567)
MSVQETFAMLMLYNSDAFAVVRFDHEGASDNAASPAVEGAPAGASEPIGGVLRGFEIVDKRSRKEIFLSGLLAQSFQQGAQALSETNPTPEQWDDYIEGFTALAQQPLVMH